MLRVGLGTDIHPFEASRKLILGGVDIPHTVGLGGHSDADCVVHALCDALLGAAALGDLGEHFPSNEVNKNRSSLEILSEVCQKVWARGFAIVNADIVIMAEEPKLAPYKELMAEKIASILNVEKTAIGIKATTCEKLGAIGRKEGIMSQAVVLLEKKKYD